MYFINVVEFNKLLSNILDFIDCHSKLLVFNCVYKDG